MPELTLHPEENAFAYQIISDDRAFQAGDRIETIGGSGPSGSGEQYTLACAHPDDNEYYLFRGDEPNPGGNTCIEHGSRWVVSRGSIRLIEPATPPTSEPRLNGMRHAEIYDPSSYLTKRVAVIGVGTIGSHLANILGRMQVPMTLFDEDTIEEHNLATQSYSAIDIKRPKVEAVLEQLDGLDSGIVHKAVDMNYSGTEIEADLVVSCVDSLEARKMIAERMIANNFIRPIMDGRVGREQAEVYYYATPQEWLAGLPETADTDPCGARFTAYTAVICAGFLANNIKRFLVGQSLPSRILYDAASGSYIHKQEYKFADETPTELEAQNVEPALAVTES